MAPITKDSLSTQLAQVKQQKEQVIGQLNALIGIENLLTLQIAEWDKPEPPKDQDLKKKK